MRATIPPRYLIEGAGDARVKTLLAELAELPGVRWDSNVLEVPHTAWYLEAMSRFSAHVRCDNAVGLTMCGAWAEPTSWIGKLYPWQLEAVQCTANGGLLLADEMGLGKTRSAIAAVEWNAQVEDLQERSRIIVAPLFTLDVWRSELVKAGAIDDERELCAVKTRDVDHPSWSAQARWYFVHYDIVDAWQAKLFQDRRGKPAAVIVDEVHWCKNPKLKRAVACKNIAATARFRMALTGTPIVNAPGDLFMPLTYVTGPGTWGTHSSFRQRYAGAINETGFGLTDQRPTHVEELRERMEPFYLARTKAEVGLKLPPLQRRRVTALLTDAQRKKHDHLVWGYPVEEIVAALVEGRGGRKAIELLGRLRKLTSRAKLATTVSLVEDLLSRGDSVVIFAWEREMVEKLWLAMGADVPPASAYLADNVFRVSGDVAPDDRDCIVKHFQKTGGCLIATYGTLREGVTLTRAQHVVLHDLDWVPSTILQAEARVHRIGQDATTFSHWVVADDTIDTIMARILLAKADITAAVLDNLAARQAADEIDLGKLVSNGFDAQEWAQDVFARWRP